MGDGPKAQARGGAALAVRPLDPDEAVRVVEYFTGATAEEADRMGVDRSRLPPAAAWGAQLASAVAAPWRPGGTFYLAWLVDGRPIGHAAIKNIRPGDAADIHLHMWEPTVRGKGHGAILFCLSALDAYARFSLRTLLCEPKASNPMPNGMLRRVGFRLEATYEGASSELSAVTTLNRYRIDRETAQRYLEQTRAPGPA